MLLRLYPGVVRGASKPAGMMAFSLRWLRTEFPPGGERREDPRLLDSDCHAIVETSR
jgi:hypothetical protein